MDYRRQSTEDYFIRTNFYDLLPLATQISEELGYDQEEMIEAICKVYEKYCKFPPSYNRTAWFATVFKEKLREGRSDILWFRAKYR